jgi:protein phosphatase 1A
VNGSLAVSRALGDFDYKCVHGKGPTEQLVSPEPEVYAIERSEVEDEFIVLACDGIWDVMANEELCDFVRSRLEVTNDLERVCNEIVDTCLYKVRPVNLLFTESVTAKHLHVPGCYHSILSHE